MGYTVFSKKLVERVLDLYSVHAVLDLGAQNDYSQPNLPAPYISKWYEEKSLLYTCVDLNGENDSLVLDLSNVEHLPNKYTGWADLVCDFGTSEHVGFNGEFNLEAYYNCWLFKWRALMVGGIMISENPMVNNWPKHGFNYIDSNFYYELCKLTDCELIDTGTQAAMGNTTDGWNVWGIIKKYGDGFPSLEEFKTLPIKQL